MLRVSKRYPSLMTLAQKPIVLVDVGAADDLPPHWRQYNPSALHVIAFEPDSRSEITTHGQHVTLRKALGACAAQANLHLTRKPQVSSIFEPNQELLRRYPNASRFDVQDIRIVDLVSLDSALFDAQITTVDAIKLDVQGAELDVLLGASRTLETALVVEVEVEFVEMYRGQPLFAEVEALLRSNGFELCDIESVKWRRDGTPSYWGSQGGGEVVFANCTYFRSIETIERNDEAFEKYVALALHFGYENIAYAAAQVAARHETAWERVISELDRRGKSTAFRRNRHRARRVLKKLEGIVDPH